MMNHVVHRYRVQYLELRRTKMMGGVQNILFWDITLYCIIEQPCSCCLPTHSEQPCFGVCHLHRSAMLRVGSEQPCPSRFPTHSEQPYLELAQSSYAPAVAHPLKVAILRAGSKQPCSCRLPTHSEQPSLEPTQSSHAPAIYPPTQSSHA